MVYSLGGVKMSEKEVQVVEVKETHQEKVMRALMMGFPEVPMEEPEADK